MEHESKRKLLLVSIALSLGALFIDRFVLSGEGPATAAAQDSNPTEVRLVTPAATTGLSIPELPFPRNLPRSRRSSDMRDIFSLPGADRQSQSASAHRRRSRPTRNMTLSDAVSFKAKRTLDAVLVDQGSAIAVVNGLWLRIGQSVDGCTLKRVERTRAWFSCGNEETILDVPGTSPGS